MVCPIWGTPAIDEPGGRDGRLVNSPRVGGDYFISRTAIPVLNECDDRIKARLTSWLVEQRRLGNTRPVISTNAINEAKLRRHIPISKRAENVLQFLALCSTHLGATVNFRFYVHMYDNVEVDDFERVYFGLLSYSECV